MDGDRIGFVRRTNLSYLTNYDTVFKIFSNVIHFIDRSQSPEDRSSLLKEIVDDLVLRSVIPKLQGELYGIAQNWGEKILAVIDRRAVSFFGIRAYGVHVNGYFKKNNQVYLWIGKRSDTKTIEPGKLDNMVAGGLPIGLTPFQNLIKESYEEAGLSQNLASKACSVGTIHYAMEDCLGLKPDTLFLYDLEVPESFVPHNQDGEISHYQAMSCESILETLHQGDQFKQNVVLVLIDFFIRHGFITLQSETDYQMIVDLLHKPLP